MAAEVDDAPEVDVGAVVDGGVGGVTEAVALLAPELEGPAPSSADQFLSLSMS